MFAVPRNPSPVPKKEEKGRRKAGAKPKKRDEGSGSENFLIKNGKQMSLCPPDSTVETEEQYKTKLEIKIRIPDELKSYIVDDWVQVCNKKRLVVLPAKITADGLLTEYTRVKTANKAEKMKNNKEKAIIELPGVGVALDDSCCGCEALKSCCCVDADGSCCGCEDAKSCCRGVVPVIC